MTQQKAKLDVSELENGPLENRECRDVFCCLLFIANIAAMVYCSYYAYYEGNPSMVFRGTDLSGNICGKGTTANYRYLYFTNPASFNSSQRVCVTACPTFTNGTLSALNCTTNTAITDCAYKYIVSLDGSANSTTGSGTQNVYGYETSITIDRICAPTTAVFNFFTNSANSSANSTTSFSSSLTGGYLSNLMQDIQNNWYVLLGGFGAAIVISLVYMFLLRCLAGCIVWLSIIGTIVFLGGLGAILCYSGGLFGNTNVQYMGYTIPTIAADQEYVRYYGYAVWGVTGLLLIIILCLCNRIRLAVAVCKCAGKFIIEVCSVMFVPIVMAIVTVGLWAVCSLCMVYLVSAASFVYNGDIFTSIVDYKQENLYRFYYFIFGTLWSNAMVQAMTTFVIASACCMWYFSHGAGESLHLPVMRSYGRAFRYHFGSLAFGSLLLAIVQFMQVIVELFKKQAEASGADKNKAMEYVINCLRCCLACVERIVQFINKNAYIQIALSGKNFCMAAKEGFELVWSNPLRYAIVGGIGEIIMFLGKLMIAAGTTAAMYAYLTYVSNTVMGKLLFLVLVFVFSYAVAVVFMIVYSLAMDSLLVCFIVDETNQKNSGGKGPIRAPEELADLMDKNE